MERRRRKGILEVHNNHNTAMSSTHDWSVHKHVQHANPLVTMLIVPRAWLGGELKKFIVTPPDFGLNPAPNSMDTVKFLDYPRAGVLKRSEALRMGKICTTWYDPSIVCRTS